MMIRVFIAFFSLFLCAITCNICVIGLKENDTIGGVRYFIIRIAQFITAFTVNACGGTLWYKFSRPKACYKKYLGPDWEADYDWRRNCGCVITNHSTLMDTFTNSLQQISSFVAKFEATLDYSIGQMIKATQCLVIDRGNKSSKTLIQEKVTQRIQEGETTTHYDPLILFVEGGTTNG